MTTPTMMNAQALAKDLKQMLERQDYETAYNNLFSEQVENVEVTPTDNISTKGRQACIEKNRMWYDLMEIHSMQISEPLIADCCFVLKCTSDVTNRKTGKRMQLEELAVYTTKDNKITREMFFHPNGNPMDM